MTTSELLPPIVPRSPAHGSSSAESAPAPLPPAVAAALDGLGSGCVLVDSQWRILYANAAAATLALRAAAELAGRDFWSEFSRLRGTATEREGRRAMTEGTAAQWEDFIPGAGRWYGVETAPWPGGLTLLLRDITAGKQAEAAQRASIERFQRAVTNPALTLFEQDHELRYTWLFPVHPEHARALGRTDLELEPHGAGQLLTEWKQQVIALGTELRREIRTELPSGVRHYEVFMGPVRSATGETTGVIGAALDITARKLAEQALRETEARFQATLDNSSALIFLKDNEGRFVLTNRQHERLFGQTRSQIVGRTVREVCTDELAQRLEAGDEAVLAAGRALEFEETISTPDGDRTYLAIKFPLKDTTGRVTGIGGIATDITERKRAEVQQQALYDLVDRVNRAAALPEIYDAALDTISACLGTPRASILLYDADGVMRFKAWRGLSGSYRAAVEGHSPWARDERNPEVVTVEDVTTATLEPALRATILRENIHSCAFIPLCFEQRLLGKFMVYFAAPHAFAPDELRLAKTIANQVAFAIERQRSADALESLVDERTASLRGAIAQMEEFSYSVSHDLRAPLRALQGYATALLEDYGPGLDAQARDYLQRISHNSARMDRLIQDILTYSRLSRRSDLDLRPVPLEPLVREIIREYPEMQAPGAEITLVAPLHPVLGHEPSLTQVLSNLLTNAVKFVAPGTTPRVRVWTELRDGQVQLWIEDNGIGVKPEHQHRLFGLFERVHPDKRFEGTGIGLAIVRKAAERMGGRAGVESDGVHGSRFWVRLPAAK